MAAHEDAAAQISPTFLFIFLSFIALSRITYDKIYIYTFISRRKHSFRLKADDIEITT